MRRDGAAAKLERDQTSFSDGNVGAVTARQRTSASAARNDAAPTAMLLNAK